MTMPAEFHYYRKLPPELRLMIWELAPQETRILSIMPCKTCADAVLLVDRGDRNTWQTCQAKNHPDWHFKWVVTPKKLTVPPVLQVCRESRAVWKQRYDENPHRTEPITIRPEVAGVHPMFHVPYAYWLRQVQYVNYDSDVFAVHFAFPLTRRNPFAGATAELERGNSGGRDVDEQQLPQVVFHPFAGLDAGRISRIGYYEPSLYEPNVLDCVVLSAWTGLPALRSVSLVVTDFVADWRERVYDNDIDCLSQLDVHRRDTVLRRRVWPGGASSLSSSSSSSTRTTRAPLGFLPPRTPSAVPSWRQSALQQSARLLKALLFHDRRGKLAGVFGGAPGAGVQSFAHRLGRYVNQGFSTCPCRGLAGEHVKQDLEDWAPPFEIDFVVVFPEEWRAGLGGDGDSDGAAADENSGWSEAAVKKLYKSLDWARFDSGPHWTS